MNKTKSILLRAMKMKDMTRFSKLLIISGLAVLTGCSIGAEQGMTPESKNMVEVKNLDTSNPVDIVNKLVKAINQGNLEAAIACYESEATLIVPGQVARGKVELRKALAGFIANKVTITTETYKTIRTGDVALYSSKWSAIGTTPDGAPVKMAGTASDVLHQQVDGRWLIAIDNPFGAAILN